MLGLFIFLALMSVVLWLIPVIAKGEITSEISPKVLKGSAIACGVLAFLFLFLGSLYVVNPGEVGIEVLFGKIQRYSENGLCWKSPLASIERFDIKTLRQDYKSEGMSRDMQLVVIETVINYRIDFTRIADLYTKVGRDYEQKVIIPAVQQTMKEVCSQYKVEDITVNREKMKLQAEAIMKDALSNYYIVLQDVNLVDIDFAPEYNKAIEDKQIAEVAIKTAMNQRLQAEEQKKTTILQAQAEAEKQRLLRDTTSREVIQLKWIEKWSGAVPQVISGNAGNMFMLDLKQ